MREQENWALAVGTLRERDAVLCSVIDRVGGCTLAAAGDAFPSLAEAIIHQQLSLKAAATILQRFVALYPEQPFPTPRDVLETPDDVLRAAGVSGQKARYLKDLARKFLDGTVAADSFPALADEDVVAQLTQVKGIGRWTAEMYLMFVLCRPDVLPVDDLGLQRAVRRQYGPAEGPIQDQIRALAADWRPYCTIASWYLWRSLELD